MKTILSFEYKYKKLIADNLQRFINSKWTELSDEDYDELQGAIDSYVSDEDYGEGGDGSSASSAEVEELRQEVAALKPASYDVQEDGIYFVDEDGYIVAKIISTGFYAINFDGTSGSGGGSEIDPETLVSELNDLSDVVITDPANGEALVYNSTASKWKNTSVSGSIAGDFTLLDY